MSEFESKEHYDVIIIGAGVSGLSAGYYLKKADKTLKILIIEAKDRIGGRCETRFLKCSKSGETSAWDLGAQWISGMQPSITKLVDELKLERYDESTDKCYAELNGKIYESDGIPKISVFGVLEVVKKIRQIEYDISQSSALDPYLVNPAHADYLDNMTVQELYLNDNCSQDAKLYVEALWRTIYSLEANQVNGLSSAFAISGAINFETLLSTGKNSALEYKIKGGTQQISERLLNAILSGEPETAKIILHAPIIEINQEDASRVYVKALNKETSQVEVYSCSKVISSIPLTQYNKVHFQPELPDLKRHVFDFCKMGNYVKIVITYEKKFWNFGFIFGDGSTYKPSTNDVSLPKVGPFFCLMDAVNSDNKPALVAFSGADTSIMWASVDYEVRKREMISYIAQLTEPEAFNYVDFIEKNWYNEPFVGGCPSLCVTSGTVMKHYVQAAREPFLNVHLCGTETSCNWQGYMDGAVESGIRVANEVAYCFSQDQTRPNIQYDFTTTYYHQKSEIERLRKQVGKRKRDYAKFIKYSIAVGLSAFLIYKLNERFKN